MRQDKHVQTKWYIEVLQKNSLSLALLLISAFVTLLNTYSFIKLTPVIQSISSLGIRVQALENNSSGYAALTTDIAVLKQSVKDIKDRTTRIENKLDNVLGR